MIKDLFVLTADIQQHKTVEILLKERLPSLGIRPISFEVQHHQGKDSGVYYQASVYLSPLKTTYSHVLVLLDAAWAGAPKDAARIREDIMNRLLISGWPEGQCEVVVIVPELEVWLWAESPEVPQALRSNWTDIHALGEKQMFWTKGRSKPEQPKELLEAILLQQGRSRSSTIFQEIARRVSLKNCQDPSFILFRETLVRWFPAESR